MIVSLALAAGLCFEGGLADLKVENYDGATTAAVVESDVGNVLQVRHAGSGRDTCWRVTGKRFAVRPGATYVVSARARGKCPFFQAAMPSPTVRWYGADGRPLLYTDACGKTRELGSDFHIFISPEDWKASRCRGRVPPDARYAAIEVGADFPNVGTNDVIEIASVDYFERPADATSWEYDDLDAPELTVLTGSPTPDVHTPIEFEITDSSMIVGRAFKCRINGEDVTRRLVKLAKGRFRYEAPRPWPSNAVVRIETDAADEHGNASTEYGFVAVTDRPVRHAAVTRRDDGMLLVGGRPFFPIGIFGVEPCPVNGGDVVKGVRELQEAGFNTLGTYMRFGIDPACKAFVNECDRLGLKIWPNPASNRGLEDGPDQTARDRVLFASLLAGRGHPSMLAWEIGDDTAQQRTVAGMKRDFRACRACDPDLLVSHSDVCAYAGRVTPFVPLADFIKVENYPFMAPTPQPEELAVFERDFEFARADYVAAGDAAPSVMSIPQAFNGWETWKRYPTRDEMRAEAYLAVAMRAKGVSFYTYHSWTKGGDGAGETRERLDELKGIVREFASHYADFVSRDAARQPTAEVIGGLPANAFGKFPVRFLLKETGFFVAVNTAPGEVIVRFRFPGGEKREVRLARYGVYLKGK